jgi:hypothetical protein
MVLRIGGVGSIGDQVPGADVFMPILGSPAEPEDRVSQLQLMVDKIGASCCYGGHTLIPTESGGD